MRYEQWSFAILVPPCVTLPPTVREPSPTLTQFCAQIKTVLQYSADLTKAETLSESVFARQFRLQRLLRKHKSTYLLTLEECSHNATLHDRCWSIQRQSSVHKPDGLTGCARSSTSGLHAPRCRYIIHVFCAASAKLNSSPRRCQDDPTAKHVVHIIYSQPVASPSPTHSFIRAECGPFIR